jgi:hypothetical protein
MFRGDAPAEFLGNTQIGGGFSLDTDNPAIMLFSKLQRMARSFPGAQIKEGPVDEKGNLLAENFGIKPVQPPKGTSVTSQHRTEHALTPVELRSMSYKLAGELAGMLIEHDKLVDGPSGKEDGDLIDAELLAAMKPFEGRIAAIQTEFYQKGLLTDQVISGDSPKTLVQVLQGTVTGAPDVRVLIQALKRASQLLEERFRLKDVRRRARPELILGDADPRVYVEVEDQRSGIQQQTPFRLINRGIEVAHNVQIGTLILVNGRTVSFPKVDSIAGGGGHYEVLPEVQGVGSIQAPNIVRAMMESWNVQDEKLPQNECQAPLIVRYNDFSGRKEFETYTEIILFPIHEGLRRNHVVENLKILEIRNTKFRRLS